MTITPDVEAATDEILSATEMLSPQHIIALFMAMLIKEVAALPDTDRNEFVERLAKDLPELVGAARGRYLANAERQDLRTLIIPGRA